MPSTETSTVAAAIATSAETLFAAQGFSGVSVRAIAAHAGVDPALVIRHFGSKEALFLQVVGLDEFDAIPVEGPIDQLGHRLATFVLAPEHGTFRTRLGALIRASDRPAVRQELELVVHRIFVDRLVAVLAGEDRDLRARLIAAQLAGTTQATASIEVLRERSGTTRLVELCGLAVQALVDAP